MARGEIYLQELREQPAALARLLQQGQDAARTAADRIRAARPSFALLAARGSSDNAARYAQYVLGVRHGMAAGLALPSLNTLYETPPRLDEALVIGLSVSGQSPDIVTVLGDAGRQGALTVAITADPSSPLAGAAELVLPLHCGEERAVAATKSYTSELLAVAMLSAALAGDGEELSALPDLVAELVQKPPPPLPALGERWLVLGRGFNYCTAFEVALKLQETSYVLAEPYSFPDLLHGPMAVVDADLPVVVVMPSGKTRPDAVAVCERLTHRGAWILAISDQDELRAAATLRVPAIAEWLSPITCTIPGQLLAHTLALSRGNDPDAPRGLTKVTRTR